MVGVSIYTVISIVITAAIGRLTDVMFAVLGFGGMVGVAISAGCWPTREPHMVLALLAAVPALAAMESPTRRRSDSPSSRSVWVLQPSRPGRSRS